MSRAKAFEGQFWLDSMPDNRCTGSLSVGPGRSPTVQVSGELTPFLEPTRVETGPDGSTMTTFVPRKHETFTGPLVIHGISPDNTSFTLVDAVTISRNAAVI